MQNSALFCARANICTLPGAMAFISSIGVVWSAALYGSGPLLCKQPVGVRPSFGQLRPITPGSYVQSNNSDLHMGQPRLGLSMGQAHDFHAASFPSSTRRRRKSAVHVAAVEESELTLTRGRSDADAVPEAQTPLLQDAAVKAGKVLLLSSFLGGQRTLVGSSGIMSPAERQFSRALLLSGIESNVRLADEELGSTSEFAGTSSDSLDVNLNSSGLLQTPRKKEQSLFRGEEDYKRSKQRIMQLLPSKEDRGPIPEADIFFKPGDTVTGRVIWVNCFGAKVELLRDTRIVG